MDSSHWYTLCNNLTLSFAVMSVIGYVIGLGDRHLDNLLIDLNRGSIVHIDYNVCFEKGKNLRIPERVPCRLTQNIVSLFGLFGTEGLFRSACEETLDALRNGKETLITLLEAFVYDPLVDWTPGVELGVVGAATTDLGGFKSSATTSNAVQDKRDIQSEITFSMFSVRVAEMKMSWSQNKEGLEGVVNLVEEKIAELTEIIADVECRQDELSNMHQAMSTLKEAEANPNHRLVIANVI